MTQDRPTTPEDARRFVAERQVRPVEAVFGTSGILVVLEDARGQRRTLPWNAPLAEAARQAASDAGRCFKRSGGDDLRADVRQRRKTFELAARSGASWTETPGEYIGTLTFPDLSTLTFAPAGTVKIDVPRPGTMKIPIIKQAAPGE